MKNYTTKEVNELLDKYRHVCFWSYSDNEKLEQFKKDNGLLPTLEAGKWYKSGAKLLVYCTSHNGDSITGYGFNRDGDWDDTCMWFCGNLEDIEREATRKEVE